MATIPSDFPTHLAWRFEHVLPGSFRRNKQDYADIDFPILGPLPVHQAATEPLEGKGLAGPFIYFVLDGHGQVHYVGKSKEKTVIKRWVRPGLGGPASHYWTHTNRKAGCVRKIAEGLQRGQGPFELRFMTVNDVPPHAVMRFSAAYPHLEPLEQLEKGCMSLLRPTWNDPASYR